MHEEDGINERESSSTQDEPRSIEEQIESIERYCNEHGIQIVGVYIDREENDESRSE